MSNQEFRIMINDRNYTSWTFHDAETNDEINLDFVEPDTIQYQLSKINPQDYKLMTKDVFVFMGPNTIRIIHSPTNLSTGFAGVLLLENNKTFGRTENKKRLLYKCIPDDKHLPAFLVPYDIKIAFAKIYKNKYVVFKCDKWTGKHPQGLIVETIGQVDQLDAFYEYQLYCKSLHISLTDMTNKTREILNTKSADEYTEQILRNPRFTILDRRTEYIFTIDPPNSTDFDDGFSISPIDESSHKITIYIANVYFWLEIMGLWSSFSKRVATIYLPDKRRPMLPTILSDTLCSLQSGHDRFAFALDIIVDNAGNILAEPTYNNAIISVKRNYHYEDPKMISKDTHYQTLLEITKKMDKSVNNSHDLVAYWMVQMNRYCAEYMVAHKMGIFRATTLYNQIATENANITHLAEDSQRIIRLWNNSSGQYLAYTEKTADLVHTIMNAKSYIHITSPIRRLVDLLNQMVMMQNMGLIRDMSTDATAFLAKWMSELDYMNTAMRSIRKIQNECNILCRCFQMPDIMERNHTGIVFDKLATNTVGKISYMVYLEELKLLAKITTESDIPNYSKHSFHIFLFEDEHNTKKKIRLQLAEL
jgi:exoribonuclease R